MIKDINKQYKRGFKHGAFNVYNPGVLYGEDLRQYKKGYKEGCKKRKEDIDNLKVS